jgi:DNA polymerase-1
MNSLFLIDSSALAYRSFYAFIKNPLKNSKGKQTSAIFGYASQVLRLIQEHNPTHLAIIKDLKAPTFRHKIFDQYKATRKPMPEEMKEQLPAIDEFITASGIAVISKEGFEADDIMATLALMAEKKGMRVFLITRDKDMMQIVNDSICLFDPGGRNQEPVVKGPKEVFTKFGVGPEKMIDLQALMGDSSDNIPGVTKVGPKTAADLLHTYGTLEGVYENINTITRKALKENLEKSRENAFLSKKLVKLDCNVLLTEKIQDLAFKSLNVDKVEPFLKEWELNSLLSYLPDKTSTDLGSTSARTTSSSYFLADSATGLDQMTKELNKAGEIAMDTETTGLDSLTTHLVGLCLSTASHSGWYVPLGHKNGTNVNIDELKNKLSPILSGSGKRYVFHNAKFDLPILERYGLAPRITEGRLVDTMVAAHLLNPGVRGLSLDDLSLKYFNHQMISLESLIGKKGKDQKSFAEIPVSEACNYGAEDADITLRLWKVLEPELKSRKLLDLFFKIEMKLLLVLQKMEMRGISLNVKALNQLSKSMAQEIKALEKKIYEQAGEEFNIESPQQLSRILFEKLELKKGKKTKTGFSTDVAVLTGLRGSHPVIENLIDFRELTKLKNTYVDVLPELVRDRSGRVHTSYSQTITATGRLSSFSPNLQNIPIRTSHGKRIRECFISRSEDYQLMAADYSQIELRILAHLSGDPALVEAYQKGLDIHTRTAAALYNVPENQVSADQRRSAKVVNFGVIYGMGSLRLSRELEIAREEASGFIENYFRRYARVREFMRGTVDRARKRGYVETISGRRRYLPELASGNRMIMDNAERMAANTPIQGSASDLMKKAMIDLDWKLESSGLDCDMLLQVHDELVFEVAKADAGRASALIKRTMEEAMTLSVPLVVDIGMGRTWLEAHR